MNPLPNGEAARAYRDLADRLDANPDMATPYEGIGVSLLFMCHDKDTFAATIRAFGKGEKDSDHDSLIFIPKHPLKIKIFGFKSQICEMRRVTRTVAERVIPACEEQIIPEHEEATVEYVCDPAFLRMADPAPVEG